MAVSEAKRQKNLLSSGFLDNLGSDTRFSQSPIIFDAIEAVMIKYGKLFAEGFSKELDIADVNASGRLSDSIRFEYIKLGQAYEVSVFMADYAKFTDKGVQGADNSRSINTTSPYKFNLPYASAKHVAEIEKWIKEKNVTAIISVPKGISNLTKPRPLSQALGRDSKSGTLSSVTSQKSLAYAIATNIKQRGLKATNFKQNVVDRLKDEFKEAVINAAKKDISINIISL